MEEKQNLGKVIITPEIKETMLANPHYFAYLHKHLGDYWSIGGSPDLRLAKGVRDRFSTDLLMYQKAQDDQSFREIMTQRFGSDKINKFLVDFDGKLTFYHAKSPENAAVTLDVITSCLRFEEMPADLRQDVAEMQKRLFDYSEKEEAKNREYSACQRIAEASRKRDQGFIREAKFLEHLREELEDS